MRHKSHVDDSLREPHLRELLPLLNGTPDTETLQIPIVAHQVLPTMVDVRGIIDNITSVARCAQLA